MDVNAYRNGGVSPDTPSVKRVVGKRLPLSGESKICLEIYDVSPLFVDSFTEIIEITMGSRIFDVPHGLDGWFPCSKKCWHHQCYTDDPDINPALLIVLNGYPDGKGYRVTDAGLYDKKGAVRLS